MSCQAELESRLQNQDYLPEKRNWPALVKVQGIRMKRVLLVSCLFAVSSFIGCGSVTGSSSQGGTAPTLRALALSPTNPVMLLQVTPAAPATQQITATGHYSDKSSKDLSTQASWTSSAPNVATVDNTGKVTAVFSGTTTITAAFGGFNANTTLTVNAQLTSIAVSPSKPQIAKDTTQQFTATGSFNDNTQKALTSQVTWGSIVQYQYCHNQQLAWIAGSGNRIDPRHGHHHRDFWLNHRVGTTECQQRELGLDRCHPGESNRQSCKLASVDCNRNL